MSIKGLLFRFFLVYFLLLVVASAVLTYFAIKSNAGVNIGVLYGSLYYVCWEFGKKNSRYFTKREKLLVVLGLIAADIFVQLLLSLGYALTTNISLGGKALLFSVGFIGLLHGLFIYFMVGSVGRHLVKAKIIND